MKKVRNAKDAKELGQLPNIGPAAIADFKRLGITRPAQLKKQDGFGLYKKLCKVTGTRHDPCVLDVMIAAVGFMNGHPARPWYWYTKERKKKYPNV